MVQIGLISDTHGLLRPAVLDLLQGSELIVHAGDVGKPELLEPLQQIAPVAVVRGNVDHGPWAEALPFTLSLEIEHVRLYVIHDIQQLEIDPIAAGIQVVISGHSHRPSLQRHNNVYFINPGSVGPRRFRLPISMAKVLVRAGSIEPTLIEL